MSDSIWFFSRGDTEQGPVTLAQIKTLKDTGHLRIDDLVWKEGMDDWATVAEVPELNEVVDTTSVLRTPVVPEKSGTAQSPRDHPLESSLPARDQSAFQFLQKLYFASHPLLITGFLVVLLTKGCETLNAEYVKGLQAKAEAQEQRFDDHWQATQIDLQNRHDELLNSPDDEEELQKISRELSSLPKRQQEEREKLLRNEWRELNSASRDAIVDFHLWSFWRQLIFILGTVVLCIGLLTIGLSGQGAQQWFCLAVLAIILSSLFISGGAWTVMLSP